MTEQGREPGLSWVPGAQRVSGVAPTGTRAGFGRRVCSQRYIRAVPVPLGSKWYVPSRVQLPVPGARRPIATTKLSLPPGSCAEGAAWLGVRAAAATTKATSSA
ncbi:hypothetical protein ABZ250_19855 [Streptomyces afghaniensis]|uniref:hypothetical protein n=1 Tax=Streptomyces afghaniensis TaxID=66865 RepID=UPI0033A1BB5D